MSKITRRNLFKAGAAACVAAAMRETRPILTVVDGEIVYDAGVA